HVGGGACNATGGGMAVPPLSYWQLGSFGPSNLNPGGSLGACCPDNQREPSEKTQSYAGGGGIVGTSAPLAAEAALRTSNCARRLLVALSRASSSVTRS